jgi:hypothetical protein
MQNNGIAQLLLRLITRYDFARRMKKRQALPGYVPPLPVAGVL